MIPYKTIAAFRKFQIWIEADLARIECIYALMTTVVSVAHVFGNL